MLKGGAEGTELSVHAMATCPGDLVPRRVRIAVRLSLVISQGFIKKAQKTPPDNLALARRRSREFET